LERQSEVGEATMEEELEQLMGSERRISGEQQIEIGRWKTLKRKITQLVPITPVIQATSEATDRQKLEERWTSRR
jgi:hypothetical protein